MWLPLPRWTAQRDRLLPVTHHGGPGIHSHLDHESLLRSDNHPPGNLCCHDIHLREWHKQSQHERKKVSENHNDVLYVDQITDQN